MPCCFLLYNDSIYKHDTSLVTTYNGTTKTLPKCLLLLGLDNISKDMVTNIEYFLHKMDKGIVLEKYSTYFALSTSYFAESF